MNFLLKTLAMSLPNIIIDAVALSCGSFVRILSNRSNTVADSKIRGAFMGPRFGARKLRISRGVLFSGIRDISLGNGVSIYTGSQIIAGTHGKVTIGDYSHISRNSVLAGAGEIEVGSHSKISSGVMIYTVTYDRTAAPLLRDCPVKLAKVTIGNDVHIGANATILPGVHIADNATVGAGAVVTKNVEEGVTVIGSPAKPVKK